MSRENIISYPESRRNAELDRSFDSFMEFHEAAMKSARRLSIIRIMQIVSISLWCLVACFMLYALFVSLGGA